MPNSETCDYCHKRLPANTGRLCDECEASLFCHLSLEKHMIVVVSQEVGIWSKTARGRNGDTIKPPQKIF